MLRELCRRARGARTRTFTVNARGLYVDKSGILARLLRRLEDAAGIRIVVGILRSGKKAKYIVDAAALRQVC